MSLIEENTLHELEAGRLLMRIRLIKLTIFDLAPPSITSSRVLPGIFGIVDSPPASSASALEIKFFVP